MLSQENNLGLVQPFVGLIICKFFDEVTIWFHLHDFHLHLLLLILNFWVINCSPAFLNRDAPPSGLQS